jgi:ssDNA-binding protein
LASDCYVTPKGVLAYSNLFEAKGSKLNPNKLQFFTQMLLSSAAVQQPSWKELKEAVQAEGRRKWPGGEFEDMLERKAVRLPFRTDIRKGWDPDIVTWISVNCNADRPPKVVDRDREPLIDRSLIYPGCIVRLSVDVWAYGGDGFPPGIKLGLQNVQWLGHGPRLKGAKPDGGEFGSPPDDIDDLL